MLRSRIEDQSTQKPGVAWPGEDPFQDKHETEVLWHDHVFVILTHATNDAVSYLVGVESWDPSVKTKMNILPVSSSQSLP